MATKKIKILSGPDPKKGKDFTWKGDKFENTKNASKYSSEQWKKVLTKMGYTGEYEPGAIQEYLANDPRTAAIVDKAHEYYGMPKANVKKDYKLGYRWDPALESMIEKSLPEIEADPTYEGETLEEISKNYNMDLKSIRNKEPYKKRNMPFYQAAPELAGYTNALNTYNYYTPDFTHQEINAPTLNIQPQLQSIDSSLTAINDVTTGNPALDNARKNLAFTQALNAKQTAFGNKQNYDANARFEADKFNIDARTKEQNLDVEATDNVHNKYRALAKDAAASERLNAINSLSTKQAKHDANEAKKKLWLDNFYQNVEFDENGNLKVNGDGIDFERDPYGTFEDTSEDVPGPKLTPRIQLDGSESNLGIAGYTVTPKPFEPSQTIKPVERFNKSLLPTLDDESHTELKPINLPDQEIGQYHPKLISRYDTKLSKIKFLKGGKYRLPL